jgi:helicase required for RNAi-mediated heterochromatin assembly 1
MDFRAFASAAIDSRQELLYDVINELESAPLKRLNIYQQDAMRHMLTKKFAIVQGPPGTGKTFVSVTFLRLLLAQMRHGDPPIIVATRTNHALDQLLVHISEFEPNCIRLGDRSENLRVSARTLFAMKENRPQPNLQNALLSKARQNHTALVTDIIQNTLKGNYRQSADRRGVAFVLHGLLTEEQLNNLEVGSAQWMTYSDTGNSADPFMAWLGKQAQEFRNLYSEEHYSAKIDDCDQDYEILMEFEAQEPDSDE